MNSMSVFFTLVNNAKLSAMVIGGPEQSETGGDDNPALSIDLLENPNDWLDTGPYYSLTENDDLFDMYSTDGETAIGTMSNGKGIHSHYRPANVDAISYTRYSGKMKISSKYTGIGVTFFSQYDQKDAYYMLRRYGNWGYNKSFHLSSRGTYLTGGTTNSNVVPSVNVWYRYLVEIKDTGSRN